MSMKQKFIFGIFLVFIEIIYAHPSSADELFENAVNSPILPLIRSAQKSIKLELYTMTDSTVKKEIKNAIQRGVNVQIIVEPNPVGAACKVFSVPSPSDSIECSSEKELLNFVIAHQGQYIPFSKSLCGSSGARCYQHGKMAIIDDKVAMISTGNLDSGSLCDSVDNPITCDRDFSVTTSDSSLTRDLINIFENDLRGIQTNLSAINPRLTVSPHSMSPIIEFIQSAKKSLLVENQYLKDPTMNQAIMEAAQRGVQVYMLVSSLCSFGKPSASETTKWSQTYSAFDSAKIKTRIFTKHISVGGRAGYLHAKTIVVDGNRAWIGSVNGSTTALSENREFGIFENDPNLVSKLQLNITSDFNNPLSESWQESANCKNDY